MALIFILLGAVVLSLLIWNTPASTAVAGTGQQAAPTPTATARPNQSSSTSPLVAILVLLVPLIIMVWKSRGAKAPKISAASCLPVIDENKRPFQIHDD